MKITWNADGYLHYDLYDDASCQSYYASIQSNPSDIFAVACAGFSISWGTPYFFVGGSGSVTLVATAATLACCQVCITVTTCQGTAMVGATVTVTQGATSVSGCTTDSTGTCCLYVPVAGIYHVTATAPGYAGSNKDVDVTCSGTTNVVLTTAITAQKVRFHVNGCGAVGLPGANISIGSGSYTTDGGGNADFALLPGSYPYTVTKTRFLTVTGTLNVLNCGGTFHSVDMAPAPGYLCCTFGGLYPGPIPMADTLHSSDAMGALTFAYASGWVACHTGPLPNSSVNGAFKCDPNTNPPTGCFRNPNDLGTHSCAAQYNVDPCGFSPGVVKMAGISYSAYFDGCNGPLTCFNGNHRIARWIDANATCPLGGGAQHTYAVIGYTLDSPPPSTSITIHFDPGDGLWDIPYPPGGAGPKGNPPSSSITLTE